MKKIDSDALGILTKALGLTGAGSPVTELTDGIVDQSLDVAPIVRRSRTQVGTDGLYTALFLNEHAGVGTLSSSIEPYNVGALRYPPFPPVVPPQFDLWLLSATMTRTAGTGTLFAVLYALYPPTTIAFGVTDVGGQAPLDTPLTPLAYWDSVISVGGTFGRTANINDGFKPLKIRLPRVPAFSLRFTSQASDAADYQCQLVMGMFPVSLGQDGLV